MISRTSILVLLTLALLVGRASAQDLERPASPDDPDANAYVRMAIAPQVKAPVSIALRDNQEIPLERVYLGDIASCEGHAPLCQEISSVDLGVAPAPARMATMTRALVSEALAKEFPDADVFVDGPETITLRGAFNELDQESVLREFRTFIENRFKGRKDIRVRVDRLSMPSTIKTRPGKWTLTFPGFLPRGGDFAPEETLDQIIRRCAGSQTVEIRQQFDGSSELAPQTYWATAFMTLERELPISRRNLAAREIVAADDVELQWIPVGRGNIALAEDLSKIVGKRLRSTWNVGLPIAHAMLETPMAIKQGESIKMIVRDGAMEIQGRGRALQSGSVGQMIEVEYPATRKRVTARVIDSGMVEATF